MASTDVAKPTGFSVRGPESAPAILMIPGPIGNRYVWDAVVDHLSESFFCVAIDLPGHGDLVDRHFTVDGAIDHIGTVARALGRSRFTLVGLSLGGYIAQAFTAQNPDLVEGLVLCGATMPVTGWNSVVFRVMGTIVQLFPRKASDAFTRALKDSLEEATVERIVNAGLSPRAGGQALRRFGGADYTRAMVGFAGPILIANGEDDSPNRRAEPRFRRLHPQAESLVIPDAGHAASVEQPEAFAGAIRHLVGEVSRW